MVGRYNEGVPTTAELESNGNQSKYTVNEKPSRGVTLSKLTLALMALGALLLIALAVGLTILLYPHCSNAEPEALTQVVKPMGERLPKNLQPSHYRLQIIPYLYDNFTTSGAVSITFKVNEETDKIVLNIFDMEIDKESLKVKRLNSTDTIPVTNQQFNEVSQTYTMVVQETLQKGEQYEVEIKFTGHLRDNMQGFYRSQYVDNSTLRYMASTQFSPIDARRAFPCFDEPSFKSKFTISIGRLSNMSSMSNMPKRSTDTMLQTSNWEWDHYIETPDMSTYLVAFVVSNLNPYRNSAKKLFTVHTQMNSTNSHLIKLIIDVSPNILEYYERYFGIKFPLPKIDLVAVPDFGFSAMENWGLITFRETIMLFDEKSSTIDDKKATVTVLAHELAHQWFGNLVTPEFWNDLWLKEGFSNFMKYFAIDDLYPSWKIVDEFLLDENYEAFKIDYFKSSRPVTLEVVSTDNIRQMFDSISYSKGAAVIRMLSNVVGEEVFRKGLIQYLDQYKYANANHDQLWTALETNIEADKKLDFSIKEVMDTWILQAGFPVVTAVRNNQTGEVHLSQKRFLFTKEPVNETLWWIPVSFSSDKNVSLIDTKPQFWIKNVPETTQIIDADEWFLLNLQQTGYYIVNYDEHNWRSLVKNIMSFKPITRVQLISDSMDLARANLLDYDIPLKMLTNIIVKDADISFITHRAALDKVSFLYKMLISTSTFQKFQNFIFNIFANAFTKVNFNDNPYDEYLVQRIRKLITRWACSKSDSKCTNEARLLFINFFSRDIKIRPNIQEVVFCTSLREGSEKEWDYLFEYYKKSQSIYEKNIILDSLGCSQKPWILNRYLDLILKNDSGIRKQDISRVFKSVANNPVGHSIAFLYLRNNWKQLNDHFGSAFSIVSKMVAELPHYMNTRYQLAELEDFKNSNIDNLGTSSQALDRVIETVKSNIEWMDHSYSSIGKWLSDQGQYYGVQKPNNAGANPEL